MRTRIITTETEHALFRFRVQKLLGEPIYSSSDQDFYPCPSCGKVGKCYTLPYDPMEEDRIWCWCNYRDRLPWLYDRINPEDTTEKKVQWFHDTKREFCLRALTNPSFSPGDSRTYLHVDEDEWTRQDAQNVEKAWADVQMALATNEHLAPKRLDSCDFVDVVRLFQKTCQRYGIPGDWLIDRALSHHDYIHREARRREQERKHGPQTKIIGGLSDDKYDNYLMSVVERAAEDVGRPNERRKKTKKKAAETRRTKPVKKATKKIVVKKAVKKKAKKRPRSK